MQLFQCVRVCCNCSKEKSNPHQNISKEILTFYNFIINVYKNNYFKVRKTAINDLYDLVPKGVHENRTKGVENKVDDTLKLAVFLECAQC